MKKIVSRGACLLLAACLSLNAVGCQKSNENNKIKEGKNIEENDKNSIIVHEEFAKQNNLKLGDEVNLELLDIEESGSHKGCVEAF